MASITIKDMSVSYNKGKSYVLDKLSLTVADGEFCVFLGPSGCGKTTAMHCIAGLLKPQSGEISFGNKLVTAPQKGIFEQPQERNIAMVFQEYALYPNMTVRKNMSFALETKKTPKEEINRRVTEMAEMLAITPLLDRKPAQLSGGQRQRVALGRAMVRDPNVFMLDEPLGNLDAKLREQVRYELKKIQRKLGVTTVYVTHDQTEAMTMADHIVLMNGGHIVQEGTPSDLYDHPCNLFAAIFLGTPKINTFDVKVEKTADGYVFVKKEFTLPVPKDMEEAVKPYAGKEIILGIRPSDLLLVEDGSEGCITGTVDGVEPLGEAYLVYLKVGEQVIVVRYNGEKSDFSGKLSLRPNVTKLHLFDKETEKRING
ncbi:MAG: ABC transporter ATP-binding protein [Clostridia bacterium]|nr:ABC transporter ATP-binding protein [Clostridia bacterium]